MYQNNINLLDSPTRKFACKTVIIVLLLLIFLLLIFLKAFDQF